MRTLFSKINKFSAFLLVIILVSLLSSCAAAGNFIASSPWVGLVDLAAAAGITVFILRGVNK